MTTMRMFVLLAMCLSMGSGTPVLDDQTIMVSAPGNDCKGSTAGDRCYCKVDGETIYRAIAGKEATLTVESGASDAFDLVLTGYYAPSAADKTAKPDWLERLPGTPEKFVHGIITATAKPGDSSQIKFVMVQKNTVSPNRCWVDINVAVVAATSAPPTAPIEPKPEPEPECDKPNIGVGNIGCGNIGNYNEGNYNVGSYNKGNCNIGSENIGNGWIGSKQGPGNGENWPTCDMEP